MLPYPLHLLQNNRHYISYTFYFVLSIGTFVGSSTYTINLSQNKFLNLMNYYYKTILKRASFKENNFLELIQFQRGFNNR